MPRIFGVNLLGVILASIAMFFVGFVWYGLAFTDIWMAGRSYTDANFENANPAWMGAGYLIEFVAALGIGWLMKKAGISTLGSAVAFGLVLALLIGVPMRSYEFVYGAYHDTGAWLVDASHVIATFVVGSAVLSRFD